MELEVPVELSCYGEWRERITEWESADARQRVLCDRIRELKLTVARDLASFRLVFPEFTPHDVRLHADRLVQIFEAILSPTIHRLSVVEYLVLIAAIYGHDWGMSVSEEEQNEIRLSIDTNNAREPLDWHPESIYLLPSEGENFRAYAGQRLGRRDNKGTAEIPDGVWTDYLRDTHARRSGCRIRAFFRSIHGRFGDYVALVAEGHCATEDEITDATRYRTDAAQVLDDKPVNLQALAIYLRLIDLFDISDERTPYSMWRFVNPQDRTSRLEWSKHLSLAPVRYDVDSRALVFQGEVSEPDVWARVSDLMAYCEQQFAFSRALLSKRSDARYHLSFHWLDWEGVATPGIPREVVRFEFSRETLFTVLSEEVYDKDPYVFIRELLQNAIDATEARRLVLQQHGASLPEATPIIVKCDSGPEGDYTFTIKDSGIGMDPFVIQHYLAVAGKSFYRSSDFRKLGIEYDAISRFGIGILSCFMVADSVEFETQPEPYAFPNSPGTRLRIDDMTTHWAVRHAPPGLPVGTVVKVHVSAKKVALLRGTKLDVVLKEWRLSRSQLAVTSYLKMIAGFVKYPILVDEAGTKTAILHPKFDKKDLSTEIGREYRIHRMKLEYPLERAVIPSSVGAASQFFRVETLDVEQDLGLAEIEGAISFPVPVDSSFVVCHANPAELDSSYGIKFYTYQGGFTNRRSMAHCESGARDKYVACFCNGIFVPEVKYPPQLWGDEAKKDPEQRCGTWALSGVQLFLNLKRRHLNAARNRLAGDGNWADDVLAATGRYFAKRWRDELLAAEPLPRLRLLCRYGQFYPVSLFEVAEAIGVENWPVCHLTDRGRVQVVLWQDLQTKTIATVPPVMQEQCGVAVEELLRGKDDISIPWLKSWNGLPLLLGPWSNWIGCSHYESLTRMPLLRLGLHAATRWLDPPFPGLPPVEQEVWMMSPSSDGKEKCAKGKLTRAEMKKRARGWFDFDHNDDGRFPTVFDSYCFWGPRLVNSRHELGEAFLEVLLLAECLSALDGRKASGDRILNWFSGFLDSRKQVHGAIDFDTANRQLLALAELVGTHAPELAKRLARYRICRNDFLPGVFRLRKDGKLEHWKYREPHSSDGISLFDVLQEQETSPWGRLLDSNTHWPTWEDLEPIFMDDDKTSAL